MCLLQSFKEFALRGNVVDMAVGVIIGGAFGKIVTSLVNDILMPPVGVALGGADFKSLKWIIQPASMAADGTPIEAVAMQYGSFAQTIFDFLIITACIFAIVNLMNKLKKDEAPTETPVSGPTSEELLSEIRDLLKAKA